MDESEKDLLIETVFKTLDDREKFVISYAYGLFGNPTITEKEIATLMSVSQTVVSRLKKRALRKMKDVLINL
jgi:DNA-directed RNA polymerase specialized sigma subunit